MRKIIFFLFTRASVHLFFHSLIILEATIPGDLGYKAEWTVYFKVRELYVHKSGSDPFILCDQPNRLLNK